MDDTKQLKQFATMTCDVKEADGENDRVLRFVGSTATRDRMGDEIDIKGWQTKAYMKNPVFLWAHNYSEPPIGKAVKVEKTDKGLIFDIEFAPADVYPKAEQIYQLYKNGFLRATSVGFKSLSSEWIDDTTEEEAKKRKKTPDLRAGKSFAKQELLELSAVPVPANPDALMTARTKGFDVPEELCRAEDVHRWMYSRGGDMTMQDVGDELRRISKLLEDFMRGSEPGSELDDDDDDDDDDKEPETNNDDDDKPESKPDTEATSQPLDVNADVEAEPEEISEGDDVTTQPADANADDDADVKDDDDDYIEIVD